MVVYVACMCVLGDVCLSVCLFVCLALFGSARAVLSLKGKEKIK